MASANLFSPQRALSSVGRALCSHRRGHWFESSSAHSISPARGLRNELKGMMRRPTKVISRKIDSVRIIKITGRLDPGDGPDHLFEMVQRFVEENEVSFLLDLRSVTYISSTGVGSLIKAYRAVLKKKGHVKLLSPSQSVRNILAISKLDGVFEIFSDENEALTSFSEKKN